MAYDLGFRRSGSARLIPRICQYSIGDPDNYPDGRMMDFFVRSEPDGRPMPVTLWEAFREGYDRIRYIHTLEQVTAETEASPSAALQDEA